MSATAVGEVYLQPGQHHFADCATRIRTLLGSCVAITLWHPQRRIGGMCHYLLPSRAGCAKAAWDGRYANEALMLLADCIARAGSRVHEYEAKLFGGGNMFPSAGRCGAVSIGERNVAAGRVLLERRGIRCVAEDVGGRGHRNLVFDLATGIVKVKRGTAAPAPPPCNDCEYATTCPLR